MKGANNKEVMRQTQILSLRELIPSWRRETISKQISDLDDKQLTHPNTARNTCS